ncbi:hypothetical protein BV25DRAFT_1337248 [Artomyces pyxidatus]|uniref:Uncharacterized protein n=1 Tax=Artomyces pyxidatus TaxID=48021 RepID=A0ACB8SNX0_9AGAM|nr:hypothetical protein BV25DRAFT_1337248 [Artomyces pyxidatus]
MEKQIDRRMSRAGSVTERNLQGRTDGFNDEEDRDPHRLQSVPAAAGRILVASRQDIDQVQCNVRSAAKGSRSVRTLTGCDEFDLGWRTNGGLSRWLADRQLCDRPRGHDAAWPAWLCRITFKITLAQTPLQSSSGPERSGSFDGPLLIG